MSKTGVITFHRADNYGAVLQAHATVMYLAKRGLDVEIIDYRSPLMERSYKLFAYDKNKSFIKNVKNFAHNFFRIGRCRRFQSFRRCVLKKGRKYTPKTLRNANSVYDVFITGSDQVWNDVCSLKDASYCLDFVEEGKKKVSYAASFGYDSVEPNREEFYRAQLSRFDSISVREESGAEIIKRLLGQEVSILSDPTMMVSKTEWNKYAKQPKQKDYILVYLLNARDELLYFAEELSSKTGCPIINITDENNQIIDADYVHNAGPLEFLGYFNNAKYVITNSFHGLMFSIVYRKSMYVDIPQGSKTTYSRLTHLLEILGIENRNVSEIKKSADWVPTFLDYSEIEKKIEKQQEKTAKFFDEIYR